uniref:Thioredoxin n=1 Tax=Crocodylus porosus TaxID=8502 RepID=A0A7M4FC53_CROPO
MFQSLPHLTICARRELVNRQATGRTAWGHMSPSITAHQLCVRQPTASITSSPGEAEFEAELAAAGDKLVVIDFSAIWCGPCKMIKPFFHGLVEKYKNVVFLEVDVDDAQDVAEHCQIKCMPTFLFYKSGKRVKEFSGANKEKLEENIKELM